MNQTINPEKIKHLLKKLEEDGRSLSGDEVFDAGFQDGLAWVLGLLEDNDLDNVQDLVADFEKVSK